MHTDLCTPTIFTAPHTASPQLFHSPQPSSPYNPLVNKMTGLEDLGTFLPRFTIPKLPPLAIISVLFTSKGIHAIISPSMGTVHQAYYPNDPIEPNTTNHLSYSTRRLLARIATSQVYVWGRNSGNNMCLSDPRHARPEDAVNFQGSDEYIVSSPMRSEMLSRLGAKKLVVHDHLLVALSLEGKVYITNYENHEWPKRLFEFECPELIVDVVSGSVVIALSDTGRLYGWSSCDEYKLPHKLGEIDLQSVFELEDQPRVLSISTGWETTACILEDGPVVAWHRSISRKQGYIGYAATVPKVSSSLEPDWKVVDVGVASQYLVLLLVNGQIYTVHYCLTCTGLSCPPTDTKLSFMTPTLYRRIGPVERVWCTYTSIFTLSCEQRLFEIESEDLRCAFYDNNPRELGGIDAARICTIVGSHRHLDFILMDDGTCYVWGETDTDYRRPFFRGLMEISSEGGGVSYCETKPEEYWIHHNHFIRAKRPEKINLKHIVSVAARIDKCAAIVLDPKDVSRLMLKP